MNEYIGNVALGWLVASLALVTEHVVLWDRPWRLIPPWSYVAGLLTVLAGCLVWTWRQALRGPIDPWLAFGAVAAISTSGGWIILAYWLRGGFQVIKEKRQQLDQAKDKLTQVLDEPLDDLRRN